MFSNLNWTNVAILLLLALFIFGSKLPEMISEGLRMVRNLHRMAQKATTDLGRELGTDIKLQDLHPKTLVRKHVLSEDDQEALTKPLKGISEDLIRHGQSLQDDITGPTARTPVAKSTGPTSAAAEGDKPDSGAVSEKPPTGTSSAQPPAPRHHFDDIT